MMVTYLVDTNHITLAVEHAGVRARLRGLLNKGARFGISVAVLCELEAGIAGCIDPTRTRRDVERVTGEMRLWPIDATTARLYGEIHRDLRSRGRALSQVDIMTAALARQMRATILTADRDFRALSGLRTEDWSDSSAVG